MSRQTVLHLGLGLLGLGGCVALTLLHVPASSLLSFFFLALVAILTLDAPLSAALCVLAIVLSGVLLKEVPQGPRPVATGVILIVESWFSGTCALVWGLVWRLRRQMQSTARARENVLPLVAQPRPEHIYARMIDDAPDGVVVVDSAGLIVLANKQTETLFGYTRDEMLGQPVESLLPVHVRARHEGHRAGFLADPRVRPMGSGLELFARRASGVSFPVLISLSPLETDQAGNRQVLVMAAVRDISARKDADAALARERAEREAAEAAVAERDAFLSISAHELRTPLTSLRGYSELLTEAVRSADALVADSTLPPAYARLRRQAAQAIAAIDRQSTKMAALVDKLLDVARLGRGTFSIEAEQGALDALTRDVVATAQQTYPERHIVFVDEAGAGAGAGRPLLLRFDALRLEQALANLIDNGIKFSTAPTEISVRLWDEGDHARLSVCDAGCGIPPGERGLVVQRFYQIKAREKSSGMGLGLWVASEIATLHGGTLTIADNLASPTGSGTCVTLSLPLDSAPLPGL